MMQNSQRWLCVATLVLGACSGGSGNSNAGAGNPCNSSGGMGDAMVGHAQTLTNMPEDAGATAPQAPALGPLTVTVKDPTPLPAGLNPRVQITAPADNALLRTNSVEVRLRVTDWDAPNESKHIHLILDNEPYKRVDDPSQPVSLTNLSEGTHVLRAFPGWRTHESIKKDGAFAVAVFHVGRRTANFAFDRRAPLLTYSRPKGDYNNADAEHILLDFYLSNVAPTAMGSSGFRVRYTIDGSALTGEAIEWKPYVIDNLPDGEHTIVLDLLGADGQPVAGPFNHIERTIRVNRNAPVATGDAGVSPHAGH